MTMVPFSDRDERILTVDNAGSGLVMYQDKLLGNYQPVKTLIPGILTTSQRLARVDLLALNKAQIKDSNTGFTWEVNNGVWVRTTEDSIQNVISGTVATVSGVTYDGSNRVTGFTIGTVVYTVAGWGTSTITITGSDGSIRVMTLDGSGRISGVTSS